MADPVNPELADIEMTDSNRNCPAIMPGSLIIYMLQ